MARLGDLTDRCADLFFLEIFWERITGTLTRPGDAD
jgi:hypothetical protein